jgi:hypothetical protein
LFIHVRLREGADDDLRDWYEDQEDKSGAVREAIRAFIRMQNGESQETAIREAVSKATASLPVVVAEAVKEALANYQLSPAQERQAAGDEDPELAARLDAQLDDWSD